MKMIPRIAIVSIVIAMAGCTNDSMDPTGPSPVDESGVPPGDPSHGDPQPDDPQPVDPPTPPGPTHTIATNAYLTVGQVRNGQPGHVSVSGHVLCKSCGAIVTGTVNVNFNKFEDGKYMYNKTAYPILVNGRYEVLNVAVGVGRWRVRAVFREQGNYAESISEYRYFEVTAR